MRTKQSFIIEKYIDDNIKVGDIVHLFDGSALTLHEDNVTKETEGDYFIPYNYPALGFKKPLKSYNWKVVETNITDRVASGVINNVYLQDIIVECQGIKFRTSSGMVTKI